MNINQITSAEYIYNLNNEKAVIRVVANEKDYWIPLDEANTDYQAIQEWIAEGNTVIDNPPE